MDLLFVNARGKHSGEGRHEMQISFSVRNCCYMRRLTALATHCSREFMTQIGFEDEAMSCVIGRTSLTELMASCLFF